MRRGWDKEEAWGLGGTVVAERKKEEWTGSLPRNRAGPTCPAPSGKWGERDRRRCGRWCGGILYRMGRGGPGLYQFALSSR